MSDYTIFVQHQAQVFLGGPPLVKMATGEVVESETLGGAEMHSRTSGLSDFLAPDEFSAIAAARRWVRGINSQQRLAPGRVIEPKYDVEELLGIVGTDIRRGIMPMGEIIARIVDESRFEVFKPLYGKNMLCCWAYIHGSQPPKRTNYAGHLTGIIANAGPVIFVAEAHKTTQFIRLCNASSIPIVYLHNVTGFMVGAKTESQGLIKAGAQLVNAVSNSKVPFPPPDIDTVGPPDQYRLRRELRRR
jgi:acetyl-CoA carboxylase carboxyltransferase component